jgi:hypothetical protein
MREEKVILVGTVIEVDIVDIDGESDVSCFVISCDGDFCDLGIEEEEERNSGELGTKLEPAPLDI